MAVEVRQTKEFVGWFRALRDRKAADRIAARIRRLELGNPGAVAPVGEGVSELKVDYGPGYRVYFMQRGACLIILLCGATRIARDKTSNGRRHWRKRCDAMARETVPWTIQDHIKTPARQLGYLEAALDDGDPGLVAAALGDIAKARGMAAVAESAGITREGLYKALSSKGDPRLSTFLSVARALGLRVKIVRPRRVVKRSVREGRKAA